MNVTSRPFAQPSAIFRRAGSPTKQLLLHVQESLPVQDEPMELVTSVAAPGQLPAYGAFVMMMDPSPPLEVLPPPPEHATTMTVTRETHARTTIVRAMR